MNRLKDIPALQRDGSNLSTVMQAVQEVIQTFRGYRGDKLDKALTLRDLSLAAQRGISGGGAIDVGIIGGSTPGLPVLDAYVADPTPPPTPTGLAVSAGITSVFVSSDAAIYPQGHGHAITVVYGAKWPTDDPTQPTFSEAVELFRYQGTFSAYTSDPATRWCIWIKWQSVDGVLSTDPAGGTNGAVTTTGQDVTSMVDAMTGAGKPFTVLIEPTSIGGVTFPAGIYATNAFLQDLQVTNAKIAALAVDDAKVANLSAAKLTAGSIAVGEYIQGTGYVAGSAGWRINGDGTAEFSNAVVRGTVYANAGAIGGNTIDATSIHSGTTGYGTGAGFYLGSDGRFSLSDKLTWDGSVLNIVGGGTFSGALSAATGTFAGSLSAATGTFSGALSAATGTFAGSLSAATGSFAGALSAATGTFSGSLTASAIDAVNTINIAGNAVTVSNSATGSTASTSTTLSVPANQTMKITAVAVLGSLSVYQDSIFSRTFTLTIDGTTVATVTARGISYSDGVDYSVAYPPCPASGLLSVAGGVSGKTVTITATRSNYSETYTAPIIVIATGLLR